MREYTLKLHTGYLWFELGVRRRVAVLTTCLATNDFIHATREYPIRYLHVNEVPIGWKLKGEAFAQQWDNPGY